MKNNTNRGTNRTKSTQRTAKTTTTSRSKKSSTPVATTTTTQRSKRTTTPVATSLTKRTAATSKRTVKATTTPQNNTENYSSVAKNIYRDGSSYRARVSVNGVRSSRNFRTKREAIQWRNEMVAGRA
jgi:hypothetical protein